MILDKACKSLGSLVRRVILGMLEASLGASELVVERRQSIGDLVLQRSS